MADIFGVSDISSFRLGSRDLALAPGQIYPIPVGYIRCADISDHQSDFRTVVAGSSQIYPI
jgi:hypothetical protein